MAQLMVLLEMLREIRTSKLNEMFDILNVGY
jgi:hypothetical protein